VLQSLYKARNEELELPDQLSGIVIKAQSGFFTVQDSEGRQVVARVRGRLKKERLDTDLVAVGDQVTVSIAEDGSATIEEVAERERALSRLAPSPKGRGGRRWDRQGYLSEREQVIVANPDEVVFVFSCAEPEPRLRMLDRFLVGAEAQDIPAIICANKIDLVGGVPGGRELFELYEEIGYPVIYTSAVTGQGVDALHIQLTGKLSVLAGPSGAGKSTLLNAMQPGLGLAAREVSQATGKGRHTTVVPELLPLDGGGWVADTPGIRAIALFDTDPEELDAYFPEIAPLVAECQFSDCTHIVEPGCAVIAAVEAGQIHPERYESYVLLREEHQRLADTYWWGINE
jgi:ribosome biogenesis GTPase